MFVLVRILHHLVTFVNIIFHFFGYFFVFFISYCLFVFDPIKCSVLFPPMGQTLSVNVEETRAKFFFYIFLEINIDISDSISYTVAKQIDKPMSRSK